MYLDVEYLEYLWPMRHYLITCADGGGKPNIIAVSFCMPVSKQPPLIAIAIGKQAYSRTLIERSKEFIVNVPPAGLKSQIYYCGFHSGKTVDKFIETGLTRMPARRVNAPIIGECAALMECKVVQEFETGDKIMFIGEVVESYAEEGMVKGEHAIDFAMGNFPEKVYGTRFIMKP